MLQIKNVGKKYQTKIVLDNLSFDVNYGDIVLYLGNNGSGKSTTFKLILDHNQIDEGEILLDNKHIGNKNISYLPEKKCLYEDITVYQQISLIAKLNKCLNVDYKVNSLINFFKLNQYKRTIISKLSKGNQQKVMLACCFIKDSDIYLLDEPFTALDKENSDLLVDKLLQLKEENKIIIFTSHNYQYLTNIIDRYIYLSGGKVAFEINKQEIINDKRRIIEIENQLEENKNISLLDCNESSRRYLCKNKYYASQILKHNLYHNNSIKITSLNINDYIKIYERTDSI